MKAHIKETVLLNSEYVAVDALVDVTKTTNAFILPGSTWYEVRYHDQDKLLGMVEGYMKKEHVMVKYNGVSRSLRKDLKPRKVWRWTNDDDKYRYFNTRHEAIAWMLANIERRGV